MHSHDLKYGLHAHNLPNSVSSSSLRHKFQTHASNCLLGITPRCPIGTSNSAYLKLNSLSFSHLLLCFQSHLKITLSYKSELYFLFLSLTHSTQIIILSPADSKHLSSSSNLLSFRWTISSRLLHIS